VTKQKNEMRQKPSILRRKRNTDYGFSPFKFGMHWITYICIYATQYFYNKKNESGTL